MKYHSADDVKKGFEHCTKDLAINLKSETLPGELVDDNKPPKDDTQRMNDISREEFNAKLETIEVKMDARVEAVSEKFFSFLAVLA